MIEQILQADRLLQTDQVGAARRLYERVVELDPSNSIAIVGLAQCALADGDDQVAHGLAARALELDPENDKARRMETRLAEILTVRGDEVERPAAASTPAAREMRPSVTEGAPAMTAVTEAPGAAGAAAEPEASASPDAAPRKDRPGGTRPSADPGRRSWLDRLMGR